MITNEIILEAYNNLLLSHTEADSNYILLNSLAILGDKKVKVSESIAKEEYTRINKYKYPERLASFIKITSEKSEDWKNISFAKIAFN